MQDQGIAIVTPGSFVVPSALSSSVECVVTQVAHELNNHISLRVYGRKARGFPASETISGTTYIRPPMKRRKDYASVVSRHLKRRPAVIIQVENRPLLAAFLRKRHRRTPVILSLHSLTFVSERRISRKRVDTCMKAANRIVVNSCFLREQIIDRFPAAFGKTDVVYPGVDIEQFQSRWSADQAELRRLHLEKLGCSGRKVILFVGRLLPMKGVHLLLQAMPAIVAACPNALLLVVGGAFYGSTRKTAFVRRLLHMSSQMPEHVRFIPYVPHDEIHRWFRLADVSVVPSLCKEAFGLVNVEAMASGVPVVASDAGGIKEIIRHGETGLLIPKHSLETELAPSILSILLNDRLQWQMGMASRLYVENHFTWRHTAEQWLNIYRKMADGSG